MFGYKPNWFFCINIYQLCPHYGSNAFFDSNAIIDPFDLASFQGKQIQIMVAQILSTGYALTMMAVIVGTMLQLREDGIESPGAIFLIAMTSSFVISAFMHPQEFACIIPGGLYLLLIPSMYMLLIIYSLINLNDVSWGTREVATKKTKKVVSWRFFIVHLLLPGTYTHTTGIFLSRIC